MSDQVEPCLACGSADCLRAECMDDLIFDYQVITLADGRRVLSVNGQGHLPLPDDASPPTQ